VQTEFEIKLFKCIRENSAMFPNFNDKAFQSTLYSLNDSDTIIIDFFNREVIKLKKDSAEENHIKTIKLISEVKNTEDIHVHPYIIFLILFLIFLVFNFALLHKFIRPQTRKQNISPMASNEIELDIVIKTLKIQHPLYLSVNSITA
jgi:hypothetical protein